MFAANNQNIGDLKFQMKSWVVFIYTVATDELLCGHPDLNVFYLKWISGTHGNWKNQKSGGRFGATS